MKVIGAVLIGIGLIGVLYGGISYTYKDKVVDAGPIEITQDKTTRLPFPPLAGGVLLIAGIAMVTLSGKKG